MNKSTTDTKDCSNVLSIIIVLTGCRYTDHSSGDQLT